MGFVTILRSPFGICFLLFLSTEQANPSTWCCNYPSRSQFNKRRWTWSFAGVAWGGCRYCHGQGGARIMCILWQGSLLPPIMDNGVLELKRALFLYLPCKLTMTFSHLKMDRWKMSSSLLGCFGLFSGAMSVSERVFQKPIWLVLFLLLLLVAVLLFLLLLLVDISIVDSHSS